MILHYEKYVTLVITLNRNTTHCKYIGTIGKVTE